MNEVMFVQNSKAVGYRISQNAFALPSGQRKTALEKEQGFRCTNDLFVVVDPQSPHLGNGAGSNHWSEYR